MILFVAAGIFLFSLAVTLAVTRILIPYLQKKKLGQSILKIGPRWHKSKEGTPTMGGIVFLLVIPFAALSGAFFLTETEDMLPLLFILGYALLNGSIGILDDMAKFKKRENEGLRPWQKLFLQTIFTGAFLFFYQTHVTDLTALPMPFLPFAPAMAFVAFFLLAFVMIGTVNCANLSDGIDGLAGSVSFIIGIFFAAEGHLTQNTALFSLGVAMCGCMLGFLYFNHNPAHIFMGDTGSLFLGALAVGGAFLLERPLSVLIFGVLYIIEGISVVLQVLTFKRTGKRLFLMAPLHHHLERKGLSENTIVICAILVTAASCATAHFIAL